MCTFFVNAIVCSILLGLLPQILFFSEHAKSFGFDHGYCCIHKKHALIAEKNCFGTRHSVASFKEQHKQHRLFWDLQVFSIRRVATSNALHTQKQHTSHDDPDRSTASSKSLDDSSTVVIDSRECRAGKKNRRKHNGRAQAIFALIESRYQGVDLSTKEWSKLKRYIYHATAIASNTNSNDTDDLRQRHISEKNKKRKKKNSVPLSTDQTELILRYLEDEFHNQPSKNHSSSLLVAASGETKGVQEVQVPFIIQSIPRILKRNVDALDHTVQFLKQLYHEHGMFYIAIQRNPNLLLTTVGVNDRGFNLDLRRKKGSDNEDDCNHTSITNTNESTVPSTTHDQNQSMNYIEEYLAQSNLDLSKKSIQKITSHIESSSSQSSLSSSSSQTLELVQEKIEPIVQYLLSTINVTATTTNNRSKSTNNSTSTIHPSSIRGEFKRRKIIGKIIASNPNILMLNLQSNIIPKVEFLQSIGRSESSSANNATTASSGTLKVSQTNYVKNINSSRTFHSPHHNDEECIEFLMNVFHKFPNILGLSLHDNLIPTLDLIEELIQTSLYEVWNEEWYQDGNEETEINNNNDLQNSSMPFNPVRKSSNAFTIRRIMMNHPQLLGLSLSNLKAKIDFFNVIDCFEKTPHNSKANENNSSLPLNRPSLAARILITSPTVYSLSLKQNIIPTIVCLAKLWGIDVMTMMDCGSDDDDILDLMRKNNNSNNKSLIAKADLASYNHLGRKIAEYPLILTLSLEGNIQPTINFYNRTGYINLDDSGRSIDTKMSGNNKNVKRNGEYLPARYLATSLFNRLLPRWNYYVVEESKRINKEQAMTEIQRDGTDEIKTKRSLTHPPLHLIANASDEKFCEQMEYDLRSYVEFKDEAVPRLKFSSQFDTWLKTGRPIDIS